MMLIKIYILFCIVGSNLNAWMGAIYQISLGLYGYLQILLCASRKRTLKVMTQKILLLRLNIEQESDLVDFTCFFLRIFMFFFFIFLAALPLRGKPYLT